MPPRPSGKGKGKGMGKGKGKGMARPCCDRFYQLRDFFIQTINQGTFTQIEIFFDGITTPTPLPAGQMRPIELGQAQQESLFVNSINWFDEQNCRILLQSQVIPSPEFLANDRFIDCQTLSSTFSRVQAGLT